MPNQNAMNRKTFQFATWLMWLALPLTGLRFYLVWDMLPARMATHFGVNGQPNGWMTRETAFVFGIGITAFILAVFTIIALVANRQAAGEKVSWVLLAFAYTVVGCIVYANDSVIEYNLSGKPVEIGPMLLIVPVVLIVLTAVFILSRRGDRLPESSPIATETHGSPAWATVFLAPLAAVVWTFAAVPQSGARWGGALLCLMFLMIAAFAWKGFEYRFTPAGVEIRTLGLRLRSIPSSEIQTYEVGKWNALRGYGIRGIGRSRAYVWGNKVVHIHTPHGDVYLGHSDPQRIVRDLDAVKQFAR